MSRPPGAGILVVGLVAALSLLAALGYGAWYVVSRARGAGADDVVRVDATLALEPVAAGTRVRLTLQPVGPVRAPVRVAAGAVDEAYSIDAPPFSGDVVAGPAATGLEVAWTAAESGGRPLARAGVGFEPLRRNGSDYEMSALVPVVAGRRVLVLRGLGQFLDVRTLTVSAPPGAVTSCLLTYSDSTFRAHRVTPCEPSTSMRPQLPSQVRRGGGQGEQEVRLELAGP